MITHLLFPDDVATVKILQILEPFSAEERKLILAMVEANPWWPQTVVRHAKKGPHAVEMPEDFEIPVSVLRLEDAAIEQYLDSFIAERCEIRTDAFVSVTSLVAAYISWEKALTQLDNPVVHNVTERLKSRFPESRRRRMDGKKFRAFEGVGLREVSV